MSTTAADPQAADILGDQLAKTLQDIQGEGEAFRAKMESDRDEIAAVRDAMLRRMAEGPRTSPGASMPPEGAAEILSILSSQPRLIPPTQAFLAEKVKQLNDAVDEILGPLPTADGGGS